MHEAQLRAQALETALNDAHLQNTAAVVSLATQGKSRLLLGSSVSANPQLGKIPVTVGQGKSGKLTAAFPGSKDVSAVHPAWQAKIDLPGIEGQVRAYLNLDITMV